MWGDQDTTVPKPTPVARPQPAPVPEEPQECTPSAFIGVASGSIREEIRNFSEEIAAGLPEVDVIAEDARPAKRRKTAGPIFAGERPVLVKSGSAKKRSREEIPPNPFLTMTARAYEEAERGERGVPDEDEQRTKKPKKEKSSKRAKKENSKKKKSKKHRKKVHFQVLPLQAPARPPLMPSQFFAMPGTAPAKNTSWPDGMGTKASGLFGSGVNMAHAEQGRPGGREKVPCQGTPGCRQDLLSAHIELRPEEHSKQTGGIHDLHHDRSHGVGSVRLDVGARYKT